MQLVSFWIRTQIGYSIFYEDDCYFNHASKSHVGEKYIGGCDAHASLWTSGLDRYDLR